MFSKRSNVPVPCLRCNRHEMEVLHAKYKASASNYWVYKIPVASCCSRCDHEDKRGLWARYPVCRRWLCDSPFEFVQVPIPIAIVGEIERNIQSASTTTSGTEYRPHGTFISLLSTMDCPEEYKQSLCCWVPQAMQAFMRGDPRVSRLFRCGLQKDGADEPASTTSGPGASPSATLKQVEEVDTSLTAALVAPPANPGAEEGMPGTQVEGNAYGEEDRVHGISTPNDPKVLAYPIGPDLIPTEVMDSSVSNLKAGLAKRVKPLPFKADTNMIRKINKTVDALLKHVFSDSKVKAWRVKNPYCEEFCSSKWSPDRFRRAFDEALSETRVKIEQTFQIKTNEALPAKDKAPRPIIQCGDKAQVMMSLPVKCFEELLFEHFEDASIKHVPKHAAMQRVAKHLKQQNAHLVEGDGSAWDACCNSKIRSMTENRILKSIIEALGHDHEVPQDWMRKVVGDMEKDKIKGKAKVSDSCMTPIRVCIESIRQSGHRGTSCFNYLINLVCWLCVICDNPWEMIPRKRDGTLESEYTSAFDGLRYVLKYAFEGDDSALSTTEDVTAHTEKIEKMWTDLGFRMKLVFVDDKLTFTGFDFDCNKDGPTGLFIPEVARNISSSSWTTSSLVKQFPHRASEVGAAAMLARAENFKDCGPLCSYFAALGLAHVKLAGDRGIEFAEAKTLAIDVSPSIRDALKSLYDEAKPMTKSMSKLFARSAGTVLSREQQNALLRADFGSDPKDLHLARRLIPKDIWDPSKFSKPRRA